MAALQASGHVDRFCDYMVKDVQTGECFRADHLIKQTAEKMLADKTTQSAVKEELTNVCAMVRRCFFVPWINLLLFPAARRLHARANGRGDQQVQDEVTQHWQRSY